METSRGLSIQDIGDDRYDPEMTPSTGPRFHLYLPQMRMSHDAIVGRARAAEAAGFEGIAFMDHLAPPLAFEHDMWEAMEIAGWVLARTSTLVVGHLVLCDAFRHPAVLARQVVSLDHCSNGRFELGIGWGSVPEEFTTFSVGDIDPPARVARLEESLEIMLRLWSGESFDFAGEHFTLAGARQRPTPLGHIPITIGGTGRRTLGLVKQYADWWNVPIYGLDRIDELRPAAGEAKVSVQVTAALLTDESQRDDVLALAQRRFGRTAMTDHLVIGTTEQMAAEFAELAARGIERFYVWFTDFAPVETLDRFAEVIRAS